MIKPYHRFVYGDNWFIRQHENKLIPSKEDVIDFIDDMNGKLYDRECLIKLSAAIPRFGLPSNSNLILKGEHYEKAFKHLEYLSSSSTFTALYQQSSLDQDDFIKWVDVLFYYLLAHWFSEEDCLKLLVYTPVYFAPSAMLNLKRNRKQFESGKRNSIINRYFELVDISKSECRDLANRFSYYGMSKYLADLDCYPFLSYSATIKNISRYTINRDKDSIDRGAALIGLYLTPDSIKAAIKQ